jgi:hypothetical protein
MLTHSLISIGGGSDPIQRGTSKVEGLHFSWGLILTTDGWEFLYCDVFIGRWTDFKSWRAKLVQASIMGAVKKYLPVD